MSEAKSVFSVQPDALNALNRGRSLRCWSMATAIPAVVMIGAGAGLMAFEGKGWGRGRDRMRNEKTGITKDDDRDRKGHHKKAIIGAAVVGGGVLLGVSRCGSITGQRCSLSGPPTAITTGPSLRFGLYPAVGGLVLGPC